MQSMRMPTVFVTHGGGPLPLLGDLAHAQLSASLRALPARLPARPSAVVLCSAHFEEEAPTVASPTGQMLFDYGGFPAATFRLEYRPPGSLGVLEGVMKCLRQAGFKPRLEVSGRGLDHGAFVPLMLMFPKADVPVTELSILSSLSPTDHVRMGEALQPLRDEGVLIIGSGSSYHDIGQMFRSMRSSGREAEHLIGQDFDDWLVDACTTQVGRQRAARLQTWAAAPGARAAHPREDHLMPLLVAAAAAGGDDAGIAERMRIGGVAVSSFMFGSCSKQRA